MFLNKDFLFQSYIFYGKSEFFFNFKTQYFTDKNLKNPS